MASIMLPQVLCNGARTKTGTLDFGRGLDSFLKTNVLFDHHYILLPVSNKISNSTQFVYTLAQTNVRPVKAQLFATLSNVMLKHFIFSLVFNIGLMSSLNCKNILISGRNP